MSGVQGSFRNCTDASRELADLGIDPPESLTDHHYSGKFAVRTSPVLHERLIIEAAMQGISLNKWVSYKLAGRPAPILDDLFG